MDHVARKLIAGLARPPRQTGCTKRTKRCDFWNWGGLYLRPDCCTAHLTELTFFTEDLLDRHGFLHWLDFGSLLGAVRSQEFIPWDEDVDFGVLASDNDALAALAPEVEAAGYYLDRSDPEVIRISYSAVNTQHVDLFPWVQDGDMLRNDMDSELDWPGMHRRYHFPWRFLEEPASVSLYGKDFPAPAPVHDFLVEHRYGPKYMTPIRPILSSELYPDIEPDQLTPLAEALLEQVGERDRRLSELKTRGRLSQFTGWRRLIDAGFAPPSPEAIDRVAASVDSAQHTPTVDALVRSIAYLDGAIAQLENPTLRGRIDRAGRRARWLVRRPDA